MSTAEMNAVGSAVGSHAAVNESFGEAVDTIQGTIDLADIFVDLGMNSRDKEHGYDEEKMQELQDSIKANGGIYLPLLICSAKPGVDTEGKAYQLVGGFRRVLALKRIAAEMMEKGQDPALFLKDIPVTILKRVSSADFNRVQLIENLIRADLNPIEIGHSIERALAESKDAAGQPISASQLASQLGVSEGKISQYRRVVNLPDSIQAMVAKGEIPFASARYLATKVPTTFWKRAAEFAKTLTVVEFEAKCKSLWGKTTEESAQIVSGDAAGSQKGRTFRSAKDIEKTYIPELKARQAAAKKPEEMAYYGNVLDVIEWMSKGNETTLGKTLKDFEDKQNAAKVAAEVEKEQEHGMTRLKNILVGLMRSHINKDLKEGETKPTQAQALELAKKSVEKDFDVKTGTVKVPKAKKASEEGKPEVMEYTDLKVGTMDELMKAINEEYVKREADRKAALAKRKAEKEAEKKAEEEKQKAIASGTALPAEAATANGATTATTTAANVAAAPASTGKSGAAPQASK